MTYRFLAICDNRVLSDLIQACSRSDGFLLDTVKSGSQGFKSIIEKRPDLLIVDIGIPDINGLSWLSILRQTREGKDLPVLIAGEKIGPDEMAQAFELGADDCVAFRHCDPRELSARLRAALRRRREYAEEAGEPLLIGLVELDPTRHRCLADGREVALRPREFELLEVMMKKSGRVLSRPYLLESVWGMSGSADTRTVDVTVSRLRRALGAKASVCIESVKKFGYRFSDPSGHPR